MLDPVELILEAWNRFGGPGGQCGEPWGSILKALGQILEAWGSIWGALGVDFGSPGVDFGGLGTDLGGLGITLGGWRAKGDSPAKECHPSDSKNHEKQLVFLRFFEGRGITKKGFKKWWHSSNRLRPSSMELLWEPRGSILGRFWRPWGQSRGSSLTLGSWRAKRRQPGQGVSTLRQQKP